MFFRHQSLSLISFISLKLRSVQEPIYGCLMLTNAISPGRLRRIDRVLTFYLRPLLVFGFVGALDVSPLSNYILLFFFRPLFLLLYSLCLSLAFALLAREGLQVYDQNMSANAELADQNKKNCSIVIEVIHSNIQLLLIVLVP